jgi:hypothetical protein
LRPAVSPGSSARIRRENAQGWLPAYDAPPKCFRCASMRGVACDYMEAIVGAGWRWMAHVEYRYRAVLPTR